MTVTEIKEYINKNEQPIITETNINKLQISTLAILNTIKVMLDKLEDRPQAEWTNNMNGTFTCSECGAKRPNDNYCGNCGAKMEVEE